MTQYINDILNDFDAEFGLDRYSSFSTKDSPARQTSGISPSPAPSPQYRSPRLAPSPQGRTTPQVPEFPSKSPIPQTPPRISTQSPRLDQSRDFTTAQAEPSLLRQDLPSIPTRAPKISVDEASQIIADLRRERVKDAERMQELQTENARLVARLTILEHTDLRVAELGSRVEQLLQKYLESEQIRTQQAAQISELRQEIIVLKSRLGRQ